MAKGYGRWMAWLDGRGLLDDHVAPGDRITRDRVKTYVANLESENASGTVIARLIDLKIMAGIMEPGRDWSWIYRMARMIRARHKPARPKRHRLVDITRLLDLGIDLMTGAENETTRLRRFKGLPRRIDDCVAGKPSASITKPCWSHSRSDLGSASRRVVDPDSRYRDKNK
jgi:integrase/recombinase XerD